MANHAWQLIQALEKGQRLIKDYKLTHPEQHPEAEPGERVQKFWLANKILYSKGWGSKYGDQFHWFLNILNYPHHYQIEGQHQEQEQELINQFSNLKL